MLSRLISSATAWRTRLSLNGSLSVRMCSWRCCRGAQLDHVEVRVGEQRLAVDRRELGEDVDLVALDAEDRRVFLLVVLELVAVRQRRAGLVPVVGVLRVGHADVRRVLLHLPRAGAGEGLDPRRRVEALGQDDQVVVVRGGREREVAVRRRRARTRTVVGSVAWAPPLDSTPVNADSALEPLSGSACRLNVAATSSAVIGLPSWNLTPSRILNVHCEPSAFGFQLSASRGIGLSSRSEKIRNSPDWLSVASAPWLLTLIGSRSLPERLEARRGSCRPSATSALFACSPLSPLLPPPLSPAAARGSQEAQHRQRHPHHGPLAEELAAADVAGLVLVDYVVLELAALGANSVYSPLNVIPAHRSAPLRCLGPLIALRFRRVNAWRKATGGGPICLDMGVLASA